MKLNHSSLAVTDVLATSQFLKKYFGMRNDVLCPDAGWIYGRGSLLIIG